ncbi:hypothetical protein [Hymenobacter sp. IS2118]|uniref:hypothetical protein n=1 Tax=Hymenobacter sp. IS2118 TaxID=1505605 RepID=UPI000B0BD2FF|nr:hypothetical protein [Hymenobacter sp. IS2118]
MTRPAPNGQLGEQQLLLRFLLRVVGQELAQKQAWANRSQCCKTTQSGISTKPVMAS